MTQLKGPIIFFDGECTFCSFWVNFVLRWEKSQVLSFCASQSPKAREWLTEADMKLTPFTVLLLENGRLYQRSTAVLHVFRYLRVFWPLGYLGYLVPRFFRDILYNLVATNRQKLAPKECPLPTDRSRFL